MSTGRVRITLRYGALLLGLATLLMPATAQPAHRQALSASESPSERPLSASHQSTAPVEMTISSPTPSPSSGPIEVEVEITPLVDLENAEVEFMAGRVPVATFEPGGAARLTGAARVAIGDLRAGETYRAATTVDFVGVGDAVVIGVFSGEAAPSLGGAVRQSKRLSLLVGESEAFFSNKGHYNTRVDSVNHVYDRLVPSLQATEADRQRALDALRTVRGTSSFMERGAPVQAGPDGLMPLTVSGRARYRRETSAPFPVRRAVVELRNAVSGGSELIASTTTDESGNYTIDFQASDDQNLFMWVFTRTNDFYVVPDNAGGGVAPEDEAWRIEESIGAPPASDFTVDFLTSNTSRGGQGFSVFDALLFAFDFANSQVGAALPRLVVETDGSGGSSYGGSSIEIGDIDVFDWDVIHHEFGHFVADVNGIDNSPGGAHTIGANLAETLGKDAGIRLAWSEGFATFYALMLQVEQDIPGVPRVGNLLYEDIDPGGTLSVSVEAQGVSSNGGEDDELAVARVLWDLYDGANEDRDRLFFGASGIWSVLRNAGPASLSDFWISVTNGRAFEDLSNFGDLFASHGVAPDPTTPEDNKVIELTEPPPTFEWEPNGAGPSFRLNRFVVEFYSDDFSDIVHASPVLNVPSYTPTEDDLTDEIFGDGQVVRWVVKGVNESPPQTGEYVSPARTATSSRVDVAFVIDDTASMEDEISSVQFGLLNYLAAFDEDSTLAFQLITFKDDVDPRPVTASLATITEQVAGLEATGGDDCPEASVDALLEARRLLKPEGRIFLATDADPYPEIDLEAAIDALRSEGIRVDVILTDVCGDLTFGPGGQSGSEETAARRGASDAFGLPLADRSDGPRAVPRMALSNTVVPVGRMPLELDLGLNDFAEVLLPFAFPFGPASYSTAFVSADGFLTFREGVVDRIETVSDLLMNVPRIAPLWDDFTPIAGDGRVLVEEVGGNVVVTWDRVQETFSSGPSTFSVTLRPDGSFAFAYGDLDTDDGLVGANTGGDVDPGDTDLSEAPQPIDGDPLGTVYELYQGLLDLEGLTLEFAPIENGPPPPLPTYDGVQAFSRVAFQTGGTFVAIPEVNASDTAPPPEAFQALENTTFNIVRGGTAEAVTYAQPRLGPQGARMVLDVSGGRTSFQPNTTQLSVSGDGVTVESVTVLSPVRLLAEISIAPGAALGFRDLVATTSLGSSTESASGIGAFQVTAPSGEPQVVGIAPTSAAAGQAVSVRVFGVGTSFGPDSELLMGDGVIVLDQTAVSETELVATLQIPASAETGFRSVVVITGDEEAEEALPGPFLIRAEPSTEQPVLLSVSPDAGSQGVEVALSVTGFNTGFVDGVSTLSLSGTGVETLSTTVSSPDVLSAVVRIGASAAPGVRDVRVVTGGDVDVLLDAFTVSGASSCPTDLVIADFRTAPDAEEFIDLQNVGTDPIDFAAVTCVVGAFHSASYLGLPASGTLAPDATLRLGASATAPDVPFPDGTLVDGYAALTLINRESLPDGTTATEIQADLVTSIVYLMDTDGEPQVFGFFHTDPLLGLSYCDRYAGELHPFGQSQCAGLNARSTGQGGAAGSTEPMTLASMLEAAFDEQARSEAAALPTAFALGAAYPNPFSASATLEVDVPESSEVRVEVFDVLGRSVMVLLDGEVSAGRYPVVLRRRALASGTYVVRMRTSSGFMQTQRITVVR